MTPPPPPRLRLPPWAAAVAALLAGTAIAQTPPAAEPAPAPAPVPAPAPAPAPAQMPAPNPAPAPADATPQLQRVEISGQRIGETEERRRSTASKIIIGRDEIEKYGDSTVGELLKRLPGVTLQGTPGRGGNVRMRGLGSGYTQLLIDGERVPPGFSFDALLPEQIERIEVLRAPTAETGARAIAGTINVITRGGYRRRINDLRASLGVENGRLQPGLSWSRNDSAGELIYNFSLSANHSQRLTENVTTTDAYNLADERPTLAQRETSRALERRDNLHATGRLQGRAGEGRTWVLMPLLIASRGSTRRSGTFEQTIAPPPGPGALPLYATTGTEGDGHFTLARLNGQLTQRFGTESQVELRGGIGQGRFGGASLRTDRSADGAIVRTLDDRTDSRDTSASVNLKLTHALGVGSVGNAGTGTTAGSAGEADGGHRIVAGAELETNRRSDHRTTLQNGTPLLTDFGDELGAESTRAALYAQDEWNVSAHWAAHAGLRWEGITTRGDGNGNGNSNGNGNGIGNGDSAAALVARNRSSVWTPLLHAVFKPDPKGRDQLRISLTRSYRAPTLANLIARPSINLLDPAPGPNTPTHPDRAGNPALRPELATGIDLAFERYLPGSGLLSANLFQRRISNYLRSVTARETVSWATVPRYVLRVQNVGDAVTQGLELEAKFRLSEVWPALPKFDLRANASAFRSRVKTVPGPDNRLDQQPGGTANLGGDYRFAGLPLTVGGNLNWTPGYTTRLSDVQTATQARKRVADVYALWVVGPALQVRLSASNLDPRDYVTGSTVDADGVRERALNNAASYANWQLRLELKL